MEKFTVTTDSTNGGLSRRPCTFVGNHPSLTSSSFLPKPQLLDVSLSSYPPPEEPEPVIRERINCRGVVEDNEISIFQAERYFNEIQDQKGTNIKASSVSTDLDIERRYDFPATTMPRFSSVSSVDGSGRNYRTGSFHSTPTASSEASWNSQSGLLSNPPGSIAVSMRNLQLDGKKKGSVGSSSKWFFGRKCPCSGKKSVQVEEKLSEPKSPFHSNCNSNVSLNSKKQISKAGEVFVDERERIIDEKEHKVVCDSSLFSPENHFPAEFGRRVIPYGRSFSTDVGEFSFPVLNPPAVAGKPRLSCGKPVPSQVQDHQPRVSLDIFRPSDESTTPRKSTEEIRSRILNPFQKENNLSNFTFQTSPKAARKATTTTTEDDAMSDASSDLFEIESFSSFDSRLFVRNGGGLLHMRNSLDETATPTECYAPSEASIDWSVTTAEGFDRGSVANFSIATSDCEENSMFDQLESKKISFNGVVTGSNIKRKANNGLLSCRCEKAVNVGPHPVKFVAEQQRLGPPFPMESARIQATLRASGKPPLSRSHSGRMSRALTTN